MTQDVIYSCAADSSATLSDPHVESFLARLEELGYAACKFRDKCRIAKHFVGWTQAMGVPAIDASEPEQANQGSFFQDSLWTKVRC